MEYNTYILRNYKLTFMLTLRFFEQRYLGNLLSGETHEHILRFNQLFRLIEAGKKHLQIFTHPRLFTI
jgi:hypothetical protein